VDRQATAANRGFAIVWLTKKGSSSVFQFSFSLWAGQTSPDFHTIAKP